METRKTREYLADAALILLGSALYALGFDLFLQPSHINGGGLSGLGQVFAALTGFDAIGVFVLVANIPLFLLGWKKLGRRFFLGSLLGMVSSSLLIDVFAALPAVEVEPLLAGLCGGALAGIGLGVVFLRNASTGGTDILARLMKRRMRHLPIGRLMLAFDCAVVALTGAVFHDVDRALYSAVALVVSSMVIDGIIYGRTDSGVAMIISRHPEAITAAIDQRLDRGATLLRGQGAYSKEERMVVLCAVKSAQVGQLQALVSEIDPDAFMILQKARQVLGEGFGRYADDNL